MTAGTENPCIEQRVHTICAYQAGKIPASCDLPTTGQCYASVGLFQCSGAWRLPRSTHWRGKASWI